MFELHIKVFAPFLIIIHECIIVRDHTFRSMKSFSLVKD